MNCLSTLPTSLCIKCFEQGGGYGVWTLEDIPAGTRFGPYKGKFVKSCKQHQSNGFQWKVETKEKTIMILDGSEEKESNWLRYVNYANNKAIQNMVIVQYDSQIYFVTLKTIPANTQLFVWYQEFCKNSSNSELPRGPNLTETKDLTAIEKCEENKTDFENMNISLTLFQCERCKSSFFTNDDLKEHKTKHTDERQFECKICHKKYKTKKILYSHSEVHKDRVNECNVCHKKFKTRKCLSRHMQIHKGKRHECQICHSKFVARSNLLGHIRIHTGEKPYECKVCHKKFRFDSPFRTHMKIHTVKKSFRCEMCDKTFIHRNKDKNCCKQLPFKCKICNRNYFRYKDFLNHKSTHNNSATSDLLPQELLEPEEEF